MYIISKHKHTLLLIIFLAVAYYIAGWLGLLLAIPPGYATVFWPASGIALAMVYYYGYRLLPGVFLGSACLNFLTYMPVTLYRQSGINFLGVFQNAGAQIEARYGKETVRIWKKAVAHTLYRGLPDNETCKEIEYRSGKTSVMVRGFNVNNNQVNGSGDNLAEQSRPLLQVEDIRMATGGEMALLESRDSGYFTVQTPNFWERPELSGYLRDVRRKF